MSLMHVAEDRRKHLTDDFFPLMLDTSVMCVIGQLTLQMVQLSALAVQTTLAPC